MRRRVASNSVAGLRLLVHSTKALQKRAVIRPNLSRSFETLARSLAIPRDALPTRSELEKTCEALAHVDGDPEQPFFGALNRFPNRPPSR